MRIAYIIDSLQPGGTEKQLVAILNRLDPIKFRPFLICLKESDESLLRQVRCTFFKIPLRSFKSLKCLLALGKFVHFLKREKIDIVQTFFFDSTLFGVLGAKLARVAKIISSRRDLGFWHTASTLTSLRFVNLFVDRFLANSRAVKEHLAQQEKIPFEKIDVIYNGIDLEEFSGHASERKKRCLVVGMVSNLNREVKRVDLFLEAASIIRKQLGDVRFVVVGDGHLKPTLEEFAKKVNVDSSFTFVGMKHNISDSIKEFDVGVISSDSEGFSNSVMEYMANGIPVVATDVGGNREIIDEGINGFLVPRGEPETMALRILTLLKSEAIREEMGEKARQKIDSSFSWKFRIVEIQNYYENLLSKRWADRKGISES